MRKTRVIPEIDKKPSLPKKDSHMNEWPYTEIIPIDYNKKLIKQLLNNSQ